MAEKDNNDLMLINKYEPVTKFEPHDDEDEEWLDWPAYISDDY